MGFGKLNYSTNKSEQNLAQSQLTNFTYLVFLEVKISLIFRNKF